MKLKAQVYFNRGNTYATLQQYEAARADFNQAYRAGPY